MQILSFYYRKIGIFSKIGRKISNFTQYFCFHKKILKKNWKKMGMKNVDWRYDDDGVRSCPIIKQWPWRNAIAGKFLVHRVIGDWASPSWRLLSDISKYRISISVNHPSKLRIILNLRAIFSCRQRGPLSTQQIFGVPQISLSHRVTANEWGPLQDK